MIHEAPVTGQRLPAAIHRQQGPADKILLATANGTVVAHTAVCTHEQGLVGGDGVCTRHGSKFDITTGQVLQGPAASSLAAIPVTVAGDQVYLT